MLLEIGYLYAGLPQTLLEVQLDHCVNVTPLQGDGRSDELTGLCCLNCNASKLRR